MPVMHKAQVDGKEIDIEIPDDVIAGAGFTKSETFQQELTRRAMSIARGAGLKDPKELLKDPEFVKQVLEATGAKIPDANATDAEGKAVQAALDRQRQDILNREVNPLLEKQKVAEAENEKLLERDLQRQIIMSAAATGVVKKGLLKPTTAGGEPPIVAMLSGVFGYDTDTKEFYVLEGEGFAFSQNGATQYMTVQEYVDRWIADKDHADFIDSAGQRGPGLQIPSGGKQGGPAMAVHISRADSRDLRKLQAAKAEATKRGLEPEKGGVIIDE